jgi:hypothetical protein
MLELPLIVPNVQEHIPIVMWGLVEVALRFATRERFLMVTV